MRQTEETRELFCFYPQKYAYIPSSIDEVYVVGEFNEWGRNTQKLEQYILIRDKTDKWVGLIDVPKGRGAYKFFLNRNTYCPSMGNLFYSTVTTPDWAKKAIWYQIMVDRFYKGDHSIKTPNLISWDSPPDYFNNFGGDLKGIQDKIPYFKNLFGSLRNKAFYLNPLHLSSASNHKYWPEDYETIDPLFGNEEDLKNLIDAFHKEGAKIALDLVYNHSGLNHFAFLDILRNGKNSKYYGWYRHLPHLPAEKIEIPILENYLGDKPQNIDIVNDPRNTDFNPNAESYISVWCGKYKFPINEPERFKDSSIEDILNHQPHYRLIHVCNDPNYKCWAGFFEIPELNTKNPELKEHLFKAARKWVKLGIDGFRLDVPDVLADPLQFWEEFREQINEEVLLNNSDLVYIFGELWTGEGLTGSFLYGDRDSNPIRFDAIMNYPVRENVLNFYSGEILNKATDLVGSYGEISVTDLDKNLHKNLGYISWGTDQVQYNVFSSHDTRRLRTVLKDDRKLKAALMMQFTLPGTPTIYYGDELGMTGGDDPANRATMRWNILDDFLHHQSEMAIFDLYKKLIELRDDNNCFIEGCFLTVLTDNDNKIYSYARYKDESDYALIVASRDGINQDINIDISGLPFENKTGWYDPVSGRDFINYGRSIAIRPEDFSDGFGLILLPTKE